MSDEYGVNNSSYERESSATGWFVGIIVMLALLAIGYLVFSAKPSKKPITVEQVACMVAHPGFECEEITRWEPRLTLKDTP